MKKNFIVFALVALFSLVLVACSKKAEPVKAVQTKPAVQQTQPVVTPPAPPPAQPVVREPAKPDYTAITAGKLQQTQIDYIVDLCNQLQVNPEMALAILLFDNRKNTSSPLYYQLSPYYLHADFMWRFWDKNAKYDGKKYQDNNYVAIKLLSYLMKVTGTQDDTIIAYQYGVTSFVEKKAYPAYVKPYLAAIKEIMNRK